MFMFLLILLLILEINFESYNNFPNDPDMKPDNCYYIVKDKLSNITERQKDLLYDLDGVRTSQNMLTNRDLQFTGGCAINPKRDLSYITIDNKCNITGQILSQDIDDSTGYRIPIESHLKLKTQLDYAFPNVSPAYSCYIDTADRSHFLKKIDILADMKNFKQDQISDKNNIDISNLNTKLEQYDQMTKLYGL